MLTLSVMISKDPNNSLERTTKRRPPRKGNHFCLDRKQLLSSSLEQQGAPQWSGWKGLDTRYRPSAASKMEPGTELQEHQNHWPRESSSQVPAMAGLIQAPTWGSPCRFPGGAGVLSLPWGPKFCSYSGGGHPTKFCVCIFFYIFLKSDLFIEV